jgi:hypothetical protein
MKREREGEGERERERGREREREEGWGLAAHFEAPELFFTHPCLAQKAAEHAHLHAHLTLA